MNLKDADDFGVIDIGSNTIRGVLFDGKTLAVKKDTVYPSHILSYTEEGVLSYIGICDLCESLNKISDFFKEYSDGEIYAFATSAMRDVKNFSEVFDAVKKETDISIDLISGDAEAEYDFLALRTKTANSGIGVDLGGGSAQIISFSENAVLESYSLAIGVKRMRNAFSSGTFPTDEEVKKLSEFIENELACIKSRGNEIWFMGGTAKAVEKAAKKLFNSSEITLEVIDTIYNLTKETSGLLEKLFPERFKTMPVGLVVIKEICKNLGAQKIIVTDVGVRDGYIQKLKEGR